MTNSNFNTLQTVVNQKMALINLALAGLREQSTHSEINPSDIELVEGLVSSTKNELLAIIA
jgi:hypothetical protein